MMRKDKENWNTEDALEADKNGFFALDNRGTFNTQSAKICQIRGLLLSIHFFTNFNVY